MTRSFSSTAAVRAAKSCASLYAKSICRLLSILAARTPRKFSHSFRMTPLVSCLNSVESIAIFIRPAVLIYELSAAFKKMLKRMPMMLVGGLDAWKQEFGTAELIRDPSTPDIPKPFSPPTSPSPNNNPYTNGMLNALATGNSNGSPTDPHQVWTPRPRPGLPLNGSLVNDHRPTHSLDISQHTRRAMLHYITAVCLN